MAAFFLAATHRDTSNVSKLVSGIYHFPSHFNKHVFQTPIKKMMLNWLWELCEPFDSSNSIKRVREREKYVLITSIYVPSRKQLSNKMPFNG